MSFSVTVPLRNNAKLCFKVPSSWRYRIYKVLRTIQKSHFLFQDYHLYECFTMVTLNLNRKPRLWRRTDGLCFCLRHQEQRYRHRGVLSIPAKGTIAPGYVLYPVTKVSVVVITSCCPLWVHLLVHFLFYFSVNYRSL